jgi:hypothetical protein
MNTNLFNRRDVLKSVSAGFGYTAFAGLSALAAKADSAKLGFQNPMLPKSPHFAPRAKRVIFACMRGGPSHVDTIDYKPALRRDDGKTTGASKGRKLMESPWKFTRQGQSGLPISELLPHLSAHADKLCLMNGMFADVPSHPECFVQLHTGNFQFVRPSLGAWVLYGLGTENQNLPGFVTLSPPARVGGAQNYGSAFLPAVYQGSKIGELSQNLKDVKLDHLRNRRFTGDLQRKQIDLVQAMNTELRTRHADNEQLDGVIQSYELAFRMQSALPEVMDLKGESESTMNDYGLGGKRTDAFGRQCLYARRLAESGVRFIELSHSSWDQHSGLRSKLASNCAAIDQPMAALLNDLDQRGMLDETLVIWGGEFGRTPHVKKADGRDHNNTGFSFFMAGGGIKGGLRYGATDEHGIAAVENRTHFHDLHATILHQMGLDHTQLTYRYAGRDFRLTDVHGNVAHDIIS